MQGWRKRGRALADIHPNTCLAALSAVEGDAFERFFKEFGSSVFGIDFIPVGGKKDGGLDGFQNETIFSSTRKSTFYQASVQENYKSKIYSTVDRIRDGGREIGTIVYFTSRMIKDIDSYSLVAASELDVNVTIYDAQWISNRINASPATQAAFENHLRYYVSINAAQTNAGRHIPPEFNVNAALFMMQEIAHPAAREDIRGSVLDSLLLYALEDAAVKNELYKTSYELLESIRGFFPKGFDFDVIEVSERLALLSSRAHPAGKQITWDENEAGYSLPFQMREKIKDQHQEFEVLIYSITEGARDVVIECMPGADDVDIGIICGCFIDCIERMFREEGLKISKFFSDGEEDIHEFVVSDVALASLKAVSLQKSRLPDYHRVLMELLRRLFYKTTDDQVAYMSYLARTYALLFTLKYDMKLSSYFKDLKSNFRLVVGADILIRALSENQLDESDRLTHSMFKVLRSAGAELILTDYAIDEIYTHIVASDKEYVNNYLERDKYISLKIASQIDRILIRTYFYSKLSPSAPRFRSRSWGAFLEQFLPYAEIESAEARIALRTYLREKFGLTIETKDSIDEYIDDQRRNKFTNKLMLEKIKDKWELAFNDASHVLYIYGLREQSAEISKNSAVGYKTWWLTQETRVQRGFKDLILSGGKVIMRPEVAMHLISFAPNAEEVEAAYGANFPAMFGVRLGNRVSPNVLKGLLSRAEAVAKMDPAKMKAEMERLANKLKSDEDAKMLSAFQG